MVYGGSIDGGSACIRERPAKWMVLCWKLWEPCQVGESVLFSASASTAGCRL